MGEKEVNAGSSRRTIFERAIRLTHYGLVRTTRIARIYSLIRTATEAPLLSVLAHRLLIRLSATHPDLGSLHIDVRAARRLVTLSGDDLVVVATKSHALAGPGVKVSLHVDGSARTLVLANRPVLLKGPSSIDGWLVGTGRLGDLVGRAVGGQCTLVRGLGRWVVSSL